MNEGFSRLVYFISEISLNSNSRFDSVESDDMSDGFIVEGVDEDGRNRWFWGSGRPGCSNRIGVDKSENHNDGPSQLPCQNLYLPSGGSSRPQRFSPLTARPRVGGAFKAPKDDQWLRLFDGRGKQPVGVERSRLRSPTIGSLKESLGGSIPVITLL